MLQTLRFLFPYHKFNASARWFLLAAFMYGFLVSPWVIFLNFYILSLGYDKDFVGLVNGLPYLVTIVAGVPLALFSDHFGRRNSMMLGLLLLLIAGIFQVIIPSSAAILIADLFFGLGNTLFYINQAPYMMRIMEGDHTELFGANAGFLTLAGSIGSLISGFLPNFFSRMLHMPNDSVLVYRAILLSPFFVGFLIFIPFFLMKNDTRQGIQQKPRLSLSVFSQRSTWNFILPYLFLGLGAGFLIPFVNIFYMEKFLINSETLGLIFGLQQLFSGLATLVSPQLARLFGSKIRMLAILVSSSLIFLLMFGFAENLWVSVVGYLLRYMLVFMVSPLYLSFVMENFVFSEQGMVNSSLEIVFRLGWAIAPYISGLLQIEYGFTPIVFLAALFYAGYAGFSWLFFKDREKIMHGKLPVT